VSQQSLEDLTLAHFVEWFGDYGELPDAVVGIALRENGRLVALGGCAFQFGRWWGTVALKAKPVRLIHRSAIMVLEGLKMAGVNEVFAIPDPSIDRAEPWLHRLGFVETEEKIGIQNVWRCDLDGRSCNDDFNGGRYRNAGLRAVPAGAVSEGGGEVQSGGRVS
jgi:hypothetical protein